MRIALGLGLLALAALGLAGCASVSPAQRASFCQRVDWHDYGRNDGLLGVPVDQRTGLFADCRKLGYPPDMKAYKAGRAEGLKQYCTVESGYDAGRAGRDYHQVCPPQAEIGFLQGYNEGRRDRRQAYPVQPYFGFGLGVGSFYAEPPWWYGPGRPWAW